ncbi:MULTISPECIES: alpha/beta fold hydrolase [unclassified Myxococcus]|uniref:alpha/beta fold hydrolase n=1 Tax=unclassified Myxococcus TaxID=2648731 RepID=UPI001CBDC1DA|nr:MULTISPECIES: alpha/beta fold hydrolase [unclassified Myxococcus]MBZ4394337.1 alpha/beta fold hydrolase [Myxococcus sp. AS-1-15]MBZ4410431.1 alpha/beta fold hydrolase [Myxococcus sp. XM-1-1-1]BDT37124.1 alpha/beta fold hydrolase [Myxococcus sp. MH1]
MRQVLAAALIFVSAPVYAQEMKPLTMPQTAHSQDPFLRQLSETRNFSSGRPVSVRVTPDEKQVLFLRTQDTSNVQTLYAFDVATGEVKEVLTPEALLKGTEETLTPEEKARRERMRVSARGFTSYQISDDGTRLLVPLSGRLYVVERASGKVTELKTGPGVLDPRFSQDGKQVAYVRENDVYRIDIAANKEQRVTKGGTAEKTHGVAEFVAQEEMSRFSGYWWSPDARRVAYTESDTSEVEKLTIVDVMHPERGGEIFAYPRPGKPNAKVRLGVTAVTGGKTTWVQWDAAKYPYLATVVWPKGGPLTILVQNRVQTEQQLLAVDPATGKTRELLVEKDSAWLNLDQDFPLWLDDGSGFLWYTERNGGPEVELRKADGSLDKSFVKPDAGFRGMTRFVQKDRTLFFNGGPNPTQSVFWRVKDGGVPERVTKNGEGIEGGSASRDGGVFVVNTSSLKSMSRTEVLRADGTRVGQLPEVAQEPPFVPNTELRQVGPKRYWASITRPRDFKPGKKLPVIVDIYGGPTTTVVHHSMAAHLMSQWMADQGFLVVKFDVRGTPLRGAAWEREVKYDFATVTLDDQVDALQALAKELPELDLKRVGIQGWSFGGYMAALAALKRPDVFKAAVSGAPVVDWLDYDTHYTERYLGLPQEHPEAYEKSSLLTYAKADKPIGKLLLIHGTADDNVYFFHTLKLSDALFRAGKPHELLPLSGLTHMVPDPLVKQRQWERVMEHFKKNL